ncbi:MAG: ThiF family adenylyltransferase [Propionibacteriaceae bacterium]|jgi:proteasome lid subunit RPN8/RPN11|nr:ThiF family adenylyltransferase [Propionibacteriaceae bacterium]
MTSRRIPCPFCHIRSWFIPDATARMSVRPQRITRLTPEDLSTGMSFAITHEAYDLIARTIGRRPAETGAVLGGCRAQGLVTHVHLDHSADVSGVTYSPDIDVVNRLLREEWDPAGVDFMGFVHSHPGGFARPSQGDQIYAERILRALPQLDRLALPIVQTIPDTGIFRMKGHMAVRTGQSETPGWLSRGRLPENGRSVRVLEAPLVILDPDQLYERPRPNPFLGRVTNAYDPAVMASTRIVAIGVGGSVGYLETMARGGIGQFVLIDPDVIEAKNVGTQAVDPLDIGRPKVDALADRLARLNPNCHVWTIPAREDAIDDSGFHRLLREPLPGGPEALPATTLLCAFTDNFLAQDRVQRLGLHFGLPTLAAAVYKEGRGAELAFAAPGLTQACIRCAQSARYRSVLKEGTSGEETSDGTPFLATDRLNATKQMVTLGLLHALNPIAQADHPATVRWRRVMECLRDRNLDLTRLDPDSPLPSFRPLDDIADGRCVLDETVWTKPSPDGPDSPGGACPDCGGTGDLTDAVGAFRDTRAMPLVYGQERRGSRAVAKAA